MKSRISLENPLWGAPRIHGELLMLGEKHLRRVLNEYLAYYHESRTHLGLGKDAPELRTVQPLDAGPVIDQPVLGGLHHRYYRHAA